VICFAQAFRQEHSARLRFHTRHTHTYSIFRPPRPLHSYRRCRASDRRKMMTYDWCVCVHVYVCVCLCVAEGTQKACNGVMTPATRRPSAPSSTTPYIRWGTEAYVHFHDFVVPHNLPISEPWIDSCVHALVSCGMPDAHMPCGSARCPSVLWKCPIATLWELLF